LPRHPRNVQGLVEPSRVQAVIHGVRAKGLRIRVKAPNSSGFSFHIVAPFGGLLRDGRVVIV